MNLKTISVVALSNRDFPSFAAKVKEAADWVALAAGQGADLVVLPEAINLYKGDGPGNPNAISYEDAALDDWKRETAPLFDAATRHRVAVTIPILIREGDHLSNCFFLIDKSGRVAGRYTKICPTQSELDVGVRPGEPGVIEWEGLKVGGGICFDTNFPGGFESQIRLGAQLFLVPSLWPGGSYLNFMRCATACRSHWPTPPGAASSMSTDMRSRKAAIAAKRSASASVLPSTPPRSTSTAS
jgi:predicted amidohydrolase